MTLTDYGLTLLCSWFAWNLFWQKTRTYQFRALWVLFFGSIAVASLSGGTVHEFFLDESTFGHRILWPTTLLAMGVAAASAWVLTGCISQSMARVKRWAFFAVFTFLSYSAVVLFNSQRFTVVILNYMPAMVALLVANIREYMRTHSTPFLLVTGGILVTFVAAFIQQTGRGIHPNYFNHNATYHLVQALGLLMLFKGAKGLTRIERIVQ